MRARRLPIGFQLDLIPVMSLIVHIVPMLLLGVRFASLSALETGGPMLAASEAPGGEAWQEQEEKVVSVRITPEGLVVGGTGASDPRIPCRGACAPDTYDYPALSEAMLAAKLRLPNEKRVVIFPHPTVPFEVVVAVMDATRAIGQGGDRRVLFDTPLLATGAP